MPRVHTASVERLLLSEANTRTTGRPFLKDDDTAAKPGEGGAADPAVVLAVVRALGAFLAELPDAHGSRVNALLPALLAAPRTVSSSNGGGGGDDDDDDDDDDKAGGGGGGWGTAAVALVPSAAMRALVIRFTLPYLLQATEEPHGLDAFAAADGPGAMAFLMERAVSVGAGADSRGGGGGGGGGAQQAVVDDEARGVVAAACATLRNAMEGAERGHVGVELADASAAALARALPSLSRWAASKLRGSASSSSTGGGGVDGGVDRDGVSFLRGLATAGDPASLLARGGWRGVHEFLEALVPSGTDPGEMAGANAYFTGGGTDWVDDDDDDE